MEGPAPNFEKFTDSSEQFNFNELGKEKFDENLDTPLRGGVEVVYCVRKSCRNVIYGS